MTGAAARACCREDVENDTLAGVGITVFFLQGQRRIYDTFHMLICYLIVGAGGHI